MSLLLQDGHRGMYECLPWTGTKHFAGSSLHRRRVWCMGVESLEWSELTRGELHVLDEMESAYRRQSRKRHLTAITWLHVVQVMHKATASHPS